MWLRLHLRFHGQISCEDAAVLAPRLYPLRRAPGQELWNLWLLRSVVDSVVLRWPGLTSLPCSALSLALSFALFVFRPGCIFRAPVTGDMSHKARPGMECTAALFSLVLGARYCWAAQEFELLLDFFGSPPEAEVLRNSFRAFNGTFSNIYIYIYFFFSHVTFERVALEAWSRQSFQSLLPILCCFVDVTLPAGALHQRRLVLEPCCSALLSSGHVVAARFFR